MTKPSTLLDLGGSHYVSLTTFRRSGEEVSTPVWVALRPCSPSGQVKEGAPRFKASAEILGSAHQEWRRADLVKRKYGLEYRVVTLVERVVELVIRRGRREEWIILRLTLPRP